MASRGVALTFDDGPHPDVTPRVLDILDRAGAKATFFVVGERVAMHPELAKATTGAGHALGNHTQTHRNLRLATPGRVRWEIRTCQASVQRHAAACPTVFRAPWGKLTRAAWSECGVLGLAAYHWTAAPEGWPRPLSVEALTRVALEAARPGAILGLHDVPWHNDAGKRTIEALPAILEGVSRMGLDCLLLPECEAGP